jgi:5'-3' exonuclease
VIPPRCKDPKRLFVGLDVMLLCMTAFSIVCKATDDPVEKAPLMRPILCGWLATLLGSPAPAYLAAFIDSKGKTWRHLETEHLPADDKYKAGRSIRPPEFYDEVEGFKAILRLHRIPCLGAEGWEADDVAATVTRIALALGLDVALVTLDHDWRALVRDRDTSVAYGAPGAGEVYCWSYGRKDATTIGPAEVLADKALGVAPGFVSSMIALCGDADNIAGVDGIGPDKARTVLARYGSIPAALAAAPADSGALADEVKRTMKARDAALKAIRKPDASIPDPKAAHAQATLALEAARDAVAAEKYRGMIVAQAEAVKLGLVLATLDAHAPLDPPFDLEACRVGGFDLPALVKLYDGLGFKKMAGDVAATTHV